MEQEIVISSGTRDYNKIQQKYAAKTFKEWLTSTGELSDFELLPEETINKYLERFYTEVRSAKGEFLSQATFISIRGGLNRYLKNPPYKRNLNIATSERFESSNKVLKSVLARYREEGLDQVKHYPLISDDDLQIIFGRFGEILSCEENASCTD